MSDQAEQAPGRTGRRRLANLAPSGPVRATGAALTRALREIADSHFSLRVDVRVGAGGVRLRGGDRPPRLAGGGPGTPVPRPPYWATAGLWGAPTLINNVKTLAAVPSIVAHGGAWYASIGTPTSSSRWAQRPPSPAPPA